MKRLGPVTYLIHDGVRERSVHVDHMLSSRESGDVASDKGTDAAHDHDMELPASVTNSPATLGATEASNEDRHVTPHQPQAYTHTPARAHATSPSAALTQHTPPAMVPTVAPEPRRYPPRCHTAPKRLDW